MSQPVDEACPNYVMRKIFSSHFSNGSYGPVFIVLGVIVVISVVACLVGRLCSRQKNRVKEVDHHVEEGNHQGEQPKDEAIKQSHDDLGPQEGESTVKPSFKIKKRENVELGFDRSNNPSAKMADNGGGMVSPPHHHGEDYKSQARFADNV